ncbi:DUF4157 domain-containing protein [Deinococcus deserti]|nr:DUF4157 domain-containing protein [Deinococcus deserti]
MGAQRSLEATLGTSVRDIRVVRNPSVQAALSTARADALTVGRTVLLPAEVNLETPAGYALAAHEITHAIRHDRPGFVPTALGETSGGQHDEETVALATEHAAFAQAQRPPGLPAPWEPMPYWSSDHQAQPAAVQERRPRPVSTVIQPPPVRPAARRGPPPASNAQVAVHAASSDRAAPASAAPPTAPKASPSTSDRSDAVGHRGTSAPPVDLDLLAQDVYRRLRDRLSQEIRRSKS